MTSTRPRGEAGLDVRGLEVGFGDETVLAGVDLGVNDSEIVALVGPSGCGKTTLLRSIAGLVEPSAGRIELGGLDLRTLPTHKRDIGLMFQEHALFPHLSVAENVAFGLEMAGMATADRAARVREALELVNLADFGDRRVQELSGGEAQRVALARALAPRPSLLMLDEPLGSLDRTLREDLAAQLRSVITQLGLTAVHVTHDQAEAFAVADRIAVMNHGAIEALGDPEDLWRNPPTAFAARFLGHPNVVRHEEVNNGRLTLVPIPALTVVETPENSSGRAQAHPFHIGVVVARSEFSEGRWRHTSDGAQPLTFNSAHRIDPGVPVTLAVDPQQLREFVE